MTEPGLLQRTTSVIARLLGVFRSRRIEEDVRAEIQAHIDMRTDLLIARGAASDPDFRDLRDQNTVFTNVAAVIPRFSEVWTGDGEPRVLNCAAPTVDFFKVLGIRPILGRSFVPAEFDDLHNSTLLVSY